MLRVYGATVILVSSSSDLPRGLAVDHVYWHIIDRIRISTNKTKRNKFFLKNSKRCTVCSMNLHPECRVTSCSMEHYCRRPEPVHISAGVDESQLEALGLKPQNPSASKDGGEGIGAVLARSGNTAKSGAPLEEPLESEWHKTLVSCCGSPQE